MPEKVFTIVGLGEVLWDLFPQGKQLGGAPANFAYITHMLGNRGVIASRLGEDELGREARNRLDGLGIETSFLSSDAAHPTGTVEVQVDARGQPSYRMKPEVAWDFLEWTPEWRKLAEEADAVCFGSLAQRSAHSRETIHRFLNSVPPGALRVFDVNLRQSFYSAELLRDSIRLAHVVKLNHEELPRILRLFGMEPGEDLARAARTLRELYGNRLVCVTRGENGSLIVTEGGQHEHPGFPIRVADTVGAGDAFTAGLVYHLLAGSSLEVTSDAANRLGAWVASQAGATPAPDAAQLALLRASAG